MRVCAGCANRNEVTAYTDPENEAILQNSMDAVDALTKEKTIIMIAHRLKTVRHADQIVVVDKGRIVQQGTHEQLLALKGEYARMWETYNRAKRWTIGGKNNRKL